MLIYYLLGSNMSHVWWDMIHPMSNNKMYHWYILELGMSLSVKQIIYIDWMVKIKNKAEVGVWMRLSDSDPQIHLQLEGGGRAMRRYMHNAVCGKKLQLHLIMSFIINFPTPIIIHIWIFSCCWCLFPFLFLVWNFPILDMLC